MSRPFRAPALAAVLVLAAAGCQDYNFNPVGHCLLQPGNQRFTLSNVSSADVLFVVDDSGSMAGEQERLADAFADFVDNLTSTNVGRARNGLLPLDFHVAVTTTSIFANRQSSGATQPICSTACAPGKLACCLGNQPVYGPRRCSTPLGGASQCPVAGTDCRNTCDGLKGELYCCSADGSLPLAAINSVGGQVVECALAAVPCGPLKTHYDWNDTQCTPSTRGVSLDGLPFPDGAFVGSTAVSPADANPRVLHFDKRLYLSSEAKNAQGFTMAELKHFFEQNVRVGTCGSMQEQGLQASRRAIADALAGKQKDTYAYDWAAGLTSTSASSRTRSFTAPGGIPTPGVAAVWPTPNSKLVVVYVGDEDDCSSPKDPSAGVVLLSTDGAGADACTRDSSEGAPVGGKEYAVSSFVSYLTGLGRTVGAAFVVSARSSSGSDTDCRNELCVAGICCDRGCVSGIQQSHLSDPGYPTSPYSTLCGTVGDPSTCVCSYDVCGGQAPGTRFVETARQLKAKGADVVVGSVCGDFKPLLRDVADIVKPPQTLSLPTVPAESGISILRIASSDGGTRKICGRPLVPRQPTNYTPQEAQATGADWWFVATGDPAEPFDPTGDATVAVPSKFVYINPRGACIANPGETYSLDYLGVVPAGGCQQTAVTDPLGALDCQTKLGGRASDWECYVPAGLTTGTCQCRSGG
jgi:hypothetical protein